MQIYGYRNPDKHMDEGNEIYIQTNPSVLRNMTGENST